MSAPYPFNPFTPPFHEARGDRPPLPPRCPDGGLPSFYRPTISEIVPRWGMPPDFEIPPGNNLNNGLNMHELGFMYPSAFNDPHRWSPSCRGIEVHEGLLSRRLIVDCGTGNSNEMSVCRQFQRRGKCEYGDKCRFLHETNARTRDIGSSTKNFEVRRGHAMDRPKVQTKIVARSENPKPLSYKTRPCYSWSTTGHCSYGVACRFAHGEAELQKPESCSASELGNAGGSGTSATTSVAAEAGLSSSSSGIGTDDNKNKEARIMKEPKKLIGIYADWIEE